LTGGIPLRIKELRKIFEYYNSKEVFLEDNKVQNTHMGIAKYVKKYL